MERKIYCRGKMKRMERKIYCRGKMKRTDRKIWRGDKGNGKKDKKDGIGKKDIEGR